MTLVDRLTNLQDRIARNTKTGEEVRAELHVILFQLGSTACAPLVQEALEWAETYYSEGKWRQWGSQQEVQRFLLDALARAEACIQSQPEE